MTVTSVVLSDPARGMSYTLLPNNNVRVADYEVTATVREVTEDLAQADGALDTTMWLSAAAVTIDLAAVPWAGAASVGATLDAIGAFLVPWSRPYLVVTDTDWASPRQIGVRFDSHTHPYEADAYRQVQLAFKAPRGLWEDTTAQSYTIAASAPDLTGATFDAVNGLVIDAVNGVVFPASTTGADTIVNVTGSARPHWVARLYGPATGPKLTRDDTGQTLNFLDGLVLGPGTYLELNSAARSANLLSDPAQPQLALLDFTASEWFPLDPGPNQLRYHATSGTAAGSVAQLTITPVWFP